MQAEASRRAIGFPDGGQERRFADFMRDAIGYAFPYFNHTN
jgi:hypothetical protein